MLQSPCPRCRTVVTYAEGTRPTCFACGYPGADTRAAPADAWQQATGPGPASVPGPGPGPVLGPPPGPVRPERTSGKAVTALVLGIVGLLVYFLSIVLGPVALGLGISALKDIKASNGTVGGNGMAIAGIVLGAVGCVVALTVVLAAIVFVLVSDLGEGGAQAALSRLGFLNG